MGTEKRQVHKARRISEIEPATDRYSHKSKEWLRDRLYKDIKGVFVGALRAIETRLGNGFPQFEGLRSEILGIGNDAIRDMHSALDTVNVEYVPETVGVEFGQKDKGKDEE